MNFLPVVKVHIDRLAAAGGSHDHSIMTRTPDRSDELRMALQRFMEARKLKPTPWAEDAGLSRGVLPNFLSGRARTLHRETLEKLARQAEVEVGVLTGDLPDHRAALDARRMADIVEPLTSEDAMNQQMIVQLLRQLVVQQAEANRLLAELVNKSSPSETATRDVKKAG